MSRYLPSSLLFSLLASPALAASMPTQLLQGRLDLQADAITLPLHEGALQDGRKVWFILTDVDDSDEAARLGLAYAPETAAVIGTSAVRHATRDSAGNFVFDAGTVDFAPVHSLTPGAAPHAFPPTAFQPGSVGDAAYSPFVEVDTDNGPLVFNAPILAFNVDAAALSGSCTGAVDYTKIHDRVTSFCPAQHQVTVHLSHGFAEGNPLVYLSFDANNPMAATMESSTLAPALDALKGGGATLSIFAVANGATGATNPNRQGFDSALSGEGSPLNVLDGDPSGGYSPLWDLHVGVWSDAAINAGRRVLLVSRADFSRTSRAGDLSGPSGGDVGSTGILINCPVVALLP